MAQPSLRFRKTEMLVQQVQVLGYYPKESAECTPAERSLARRIRDARKAKRFSPEQEVELQVMQQAEKNTENLLQQLRDHGSYPKESAGRTFAERRLARKIREARKAKQLSLDQEDEIKALRAQSNAGAVSVARGGGASQPAAARSGAAQNIEGSHPKERAGRGIAERQPAFKSERARKAQQFHPEQRPLHQKAKRFSPEQEAEPRARQAQEGASSVRMAAGGGASQLAAAGSAAEQKTQVLMQHAWFVESE